jgi:hypothetical protein
MPSLHCLQLVRVGHGDGPVDVDHEIIQLVLFERLSTAQHLGLGLRLRLLLHRLRTWDGLPEVTRKVAPSLGSVPGFRTHDTKQVSEVATPS